MLVWSTSEDHKKCLDEECKEEFTVINSLLDKLNSSHDCRLPQYEEVQAAYLSYQAILNSYTEDRSKLNDDLKLISTSLFDQWPSFYNHMSPSKGVLIKSASIRALICKIKPYQEAKFGVGNSVCANQGVDQVMKKSKLDNEHEKNAHVRYLKLIEGEISGDEIPKTVYLSSSKNTESKDSFSTNDEFSHAKHSDSDGLKMDSSEINSEIKDELVCYSTHYDPLIEANTPMKSDIAKKIEELRQKMDDNKKTALPGHGQSNQRTYIEPSIKGDFGPSRTIMRSELDTDMPDDDGSSGDEFGTQSNGQVESTFSRQSSNHKNGDDANTEDISHGTSGGPKKKDPEELNNDMRAESDKGDNADSGMVVGGNGETPQSFNVNEWNFNHVSSSDKRSEPDSDNIPQTTQQGIARLDRNPNVARNFDFFSGTADGWTSSTSSMDSSSSSEYQKRRPLDVSRGLQDGDKALMSDDGHQKKETRRMQSFIGMAQSDLPIMEESYAKKRVSALAFEMSPPKLVQERKSKKKSLFGSLFKTKQRNLKKYLISN